jgi:hypothetical protein
MYRALIIITCSLLLVGCNATNEKVVPPIETDNNENTSNSLGTSELETVTETDNENENSQPILHLLTPDGIPPIETTSFSSPFGDDGNMKFKHTEIEVAEEFMDEDGRIYFDLDENPINKYLTLTRTFSSAIAVTSKRIERI